MSELKAGDVIGKCRIERALGRGGMGAVYLATHTSLEVEVAVKVLPPHIVQKNPRFAERFLREARLAAKIRHPNAVQVMDVDLDESSGLYFLVQEFIDGGSAKDLLDAGPVPEGRALDIIAGVADALVAAAAQGIVHRDIKPDNILLTTDGRAKLADLGLARETGATDLTASDAVMGTPAFMSPEQIQSSRDVDARADIYSLGATLYQLLTGRFPFTGETAFQIMTNAVQGDVPDPREVRPELATATAELVMRSMAKDPADRFQTAAEMLDEVRAASADSGGTGGGAGESPSMMPTLAAKRGLDTVPQSDRAAATVSATPTVGAAPSATASPAPTATDAPTPPPRSLTPLFITTIIGLVALLALVFVLRRGANRHPDRRSHNPVAGDARNTNRSGNPGASHSGSASNDASASNQATTSNGSSTGAGANSSGTASSSPLYADAVMAFNFDQPDPLVDLVGGETASLVGPMPPAPSEGRFGQAYTFTGRGHIEAPAAREQSVAMWVRPRGPGRQDGLYDGGAANQRFRAFQIGRYGRDGGFGENPGILDRRWSRPPGGGVFLGCWEVDAITNTSLGFRRWRHLVVSWDGDRTVRIAVDGSICEGREIFHSRLGGAALDIALSVTPAPDPDATTWIGGIRAAWWARGHTHFIGEIDEVAIWDRALTADEIAELARADAGYCHRIAAANR